MVDVPDPLTGPRQVRVAVHGAGINPVDAGNRADGAWAGIDVPHILGYDFAGFVDQIGVDVESVGLGDRVMGMAPFPRGAGGYAELLAIDADLIAPVPATSSLIEAAAVPLAAGTAHDVLQRIRLPSESLILVHGASGGVGTFFVQLAAAQGLQVIAVGSRRSHELLQELGAAHCIDYRDVDVASAALESAGGPVDAIVDLVGGRTLEDSLAAVREHGQLASIAYPDPLDLDRLADFNLTLHGVLITDSGDRMRVLADLLREGTIRPIIAEVFPLERVAEAHRLLESGHAGGKIVLDLQGSGQEAFSTAAVAG